MSEAEIKARIQVVAHKLRVTPEGLEAFLADVMSEIKLARQEGIEQAAKVAESITGKYGEGDYELGRMHASEDITEAIRTLKDGKGNNDE